MTPGSQSTCPTGPPHQRLEALADDLQDERQRVRRTNVAVAFTWLLKQPGVTPIAGPGKPHHMEVIEQALDLELSDNEMQRLSSFQGSA